jgi:putative hemolysin
MDSLLLELVIIFFLLLANGALSMAEIAVVSSRKSRLRQLAEQGDAGARRALALADNPNTFLATVQVGITLVGVLAAAFGGASLADRLTGPLGSLPWLAPYAEEVAFGAVVLVLTYFTLVIGELVPKRIGLANPEGMARRVAGPMRGLSVLCGPLVVLLSRSTDALLAVLGIKPAKEATVTEEDVRLIVREGLRAGVLHAQEPAMIEGVMSFDRRPVRDLMTPRAKIIWINAHDSHEVIWHRIVVSAHSTFPVYEDRRDNVIGLVTVKAIYANLAAGVPINVRDLATPALFVPETLPVNLLLEKFKSTGRHVALATNEFGAVTGLISLHDLLEAIVGDLPSPEDRLKPKALRREDGSWLVDGMLEVETFLAQVPDFPLHAPAERDYETVGGFIIKQLGHVPVEGESFRHHGFDVEIIDMDGLRVDKVLLLPVRAPSTGASR